MKYLKWWVAGVALLLVAASPVLAAEDAPVPKPKPVLAGEYAAMTRECKLTDEQVAKVSEKVEAEKEVLAAWDKADGAKLADLRRSLATAEDKAAVEKQIAELEAKRAEVKCKADADILAVLTPEQKTTWEGCTLCRDMMAKHKVPMLQARKCRMQCDDAAKEIAALKGSDEEVAKAKAAILEKLSKSVEELAKPPAIEKPPVAKPAPPVEE